VIIQVGSFKLTGKRVFKMAPLHHHFELIGWSEPKVITRVPDRRDRLRAVQPHDAEAADDDRPFLRSGSASSVVGAAQRCGRRRAAVRPAPSTAPTSAIELDEKPLRAGGVRSSSADIRRTLPARTCVV
jgi:hypothetical protein